MISNDRTELMCGLNNMYNSHVLIKREVHNRIA